MVDWRALNLIKKINNPLFPCIEETFDGLGEAQFLSKQDLKTGFHQIRVRQEDIEKKSLNTKYGQFEYLFMPMGQCNATSNFQKLINKIFHDFIDLFMVIYMDDLLICSRKSKYHLRILEEVL